MCGIIGILSQKTDVSPAILEGLKRLEYRGYDSAGIATIYNGTISRCRASGKLLNLEKNLTQSPLPGHVGIGHTRWATHGAPNEINAHPHATAKVAVVHNGIIENFRALREELSKASIKLETQTDTEVIPHLITRFLQEGSSPQQAVAKTLAKLEGAFALGIIFADYPNLLIAARRGSPLAIGHSETAMYIGSDAIALAPFTSRICYLEDNDWAVIEPGKASIFTSDGTPVSREIRTTLLSNMVTGKGHYRHYMQKEIYEQPTVIGENLNVFLNPATGEIALPALPFDLKKIERISLIACGTSYYAAMVARYWLENIAQIPCEIDIASEYRYRTRHSGASELAIFVSQSGETADTLAALRMCKAAGQPTLGIVNMSESSLAHEAEASLFTHSGPEISVASTKFFTTTLVTLACFTLALAKLRNAISSEDYKRLVYALSEVPSRVSEALHSEEHITALAPMIAQARDVLYIGRATSYPIALEGALKLKELSYIHAEGYAAGEMKHGPLALIDEHMPVVAIAPSDETFDKTASNIQEAVARGAKLVLISDEQGISRLGEYAKATIRLPAVHAFVAPIISAIPIQLLAYHVAVFKGTDVDQPRNLAKSVTVE